MDNIFEIVDGGFDFPMATGDLITTANVEDEHPSEIALCTLGAYNLGKVSKYSDLEQMANSVVSALDNLLDIQEYPVLAAKIATMNRRPLGIGVINFAYYLASRDLHYNDKESLVATHELFESIQYYTLRASCELAKRKGPCPLFGDTKYASGILPIDTYKKEVDTLVPNTLLHDWESLRADILRYGLRNSTLTSLMPSETSSQISNATNGIEPPRSLVSIKQSKNGGSMPQVVPGIHKLKHKYDLLWDTPDIMNGYINLVAIMQKFVDQSISANISYNPENWEDNQIPVSVLLTDLLKCYKLGIKTLYYHNTYDGKSEELTDVDCVGGACKI
jgi:ribonucleoside-diphosphate reductase alpha chain